jgi:hypothetical protein
MPNNAGVFAPNTLESDILAPPGGLWRDKFVSDTSETVIGLLYRLAAAQTEGVRSLRQRIVSVITLLVHPHFWCRVYLSCQRQSPGSKKLESCASIHLPLDHLESVNVAFHRPVTPNLLHRVFDCGPILFQLPHKATH